MAQASERVAEPWVLRRLLPAESRNVRTMCRASPDLLCDLRPIVFLLWALPASSLNGEGLAGPVLGPSVALATRTIF